MAGLYRFVKMVSELAEGQMDTSNRFFIATYRTFIEQALYSMFSGVSTLTPALSARLQEWGRLYISEINESPYVMRYTNPLDVLAEQLRKRANEEEALHTLPQPLVADWVVYDKAHPMPVDVMVEWQTWSTTHNREVEQWSGAFHGSLQKLRQRYPNLPAFADVFTGYDACLTTYATLLGFLNQRATLQLLRHKTAPLWQQLYDSCLAQLTNYESAGLVPNKHLHTFHDALLKSWLLDTEAVLEQDEVGLPSVLHGAPCMEMAIMVQHAIATFQSDYGQFRQVLAVEQGRLRRKPADTPLSIEKIAELSTRIDGLAIRLHNLTKVVAVAAS